MQVEKTAAQKRTRQEYVKRERDDYIPIKISRSENNANSSDSNSGHVFTPPSSAFDAVTPALLQDSATQEAADDGEEIIHLFATKDTTTLKLHASPQPTEMTTGDGTITFHRAYVEDSEYADENSEFALGFEKCRARAELSVEEQQSRSEVSSLLAFPNTAVTQLCTCNACNVLHSKLLKVPLDEQQRHAIFPTSFLPTSSAEFAFVSSDNIDQKPSSPGLFEAERIVLEAKLKSTVINYNSLLRVCEYLNSKEGDRAQSSNAQVYVHPHMSLELYDALYPWLASAIKHAVVFATERCKNQGRRLRCTQQDVKVALARFGIELEEEELHQNSATVPENMLEEKETTQEEVEPEETPETKQEEAESEEAEEESERDESD